MQQLHSSEEDLCRMPQEDLAEAYGTPPTRNNSIKPLRKLSGRKTKKVEKEGTQAQKNKQELMLNRRQNAKAQARKNARAFKELDTTLQVLGIHGKQASVESSCADLLPSRKGQGAPSEASSEASEVTRHPVPTQPVIPHKVQPSCSLNVQAKAVPLSIASSSDVPSSPPLPSQEIFTAQSSEHSLQGELSELMSARQEWHATLDDVLVGTHDDLEAIMISASSKAQDLREQLIMWQTPPEGTWQALQQRLDWLHLAMSNAKEMFQGLRRHWNLLEYQNRITEAVDLMKDVDEELTGMASLCCDAVAENLRRVSPTSALDVREGFHMQRNILHTVLKLHHRITTGLVTTNGPALGTALGPPALDVVMAGFEATMGLQEAVLCPEALTSGLGGHSAHETNVRARQLQFCWEECQHATHAVSTTWPQLRPEAHREWCHMYLKAAKLAEAMQLAATPNQPSVRSASPEAVSHGGGVWGRSPTADCSQAPSVSDEALQAQAWFPATLTSMMRLAELAASVTLDTWLVEVEEQEFVGEPDGSVEELIDSMSCAFYSLAATGTVRVGRLCKGPQLLACWALELLEEQACHALMFVRDLDTSLLGQNANGLEQFECLRQCTDELVNAILHVRQLLKRRRFDEAPDIPKPAGLRATRPGPSAKPSAPPRPNSRPSSSPHGNQHRQPPASNFNGMSGLPNKPPPCLSAKAAAALYRQQAPVLPSHSSQLTASLKGNQKGKRKGWPPSGNKLTGQQHTPSAANRSAAGGLASSTGEGTRGVHEGGDRGQGSSGPAVDHSQEAASRSSQQGLTAFAVQAATAASHQGLAAAGRRSQPPAQQPAITSVSQSHHARNGLSTQPLIEPSPDNGQGLHLVAPEAGEPGKASYASKVATCSQIGAVSTHVDAPSKIPQRPTVGTLGQDSRQKQQPGRGQGSGKNRPPMVAAPAASGEGSAAPSAQASRPIVTASSAQQQSPFASQKSVSFGREAAAATAAAAALADAHAAEAGLSQPPTQTAQRLNASSSSGSQSPFAVHSSSTQQQQQQQQQHPPFQEKVTTSDHHETAGTGELCLSHGDADSSLGTENRDPRVSQKEAKAAAGLWAVVDQQPASHQKLLASPFNMPTLDTLPSFTKPLPASKYKEFPSSRSSHNAAGPSAEAATPSSSHVPNQARAASPGAQSAALRAEGTQRAAAPPGATDTTDSAPAPNSPGSTPRAEAHSSNRHGQTPWDTEQDVPSPRTPLPMPKVSQSELSFKPSSSTSGPMAGCSSHSDSGFSLLWDDDPFWQLCWDKIKPTLVTKLGQGSFGQVYEGWYHSAPMAVKIINVDRCTGLNAHALQLFKQEVDLQRKLSFHPNIVRFIGACCQIPRHLMLNPPTDQARPQTLQTADLEVSGVTLAIVMELCRLGSFYKLIEQARKVSNLDQEVLTGLRCPSSPEEAKIKASPGFRLYGSWSLRLELARQAAAAVEFMHTHNVVHRDLTSNNLLVTDKWEAKVCDFNLARALKSETVEPSITLNSPAWSAPERLQGKRYGKAADVFSFGVILWELITLGVPWREMADDGTVDEGRDNFYYVLNNVIKGNHLPCPSSVTPLLPELPEVVALIKSCWKHEPHERPSLADVTEIMHDIVSRVKKRVKAEHNNRPGQAVPHA